MLKEKIIFTFMEGFHLPHRQSSLRERRTLHYKDLSDQTLSTWRRSYSWSNLGQGCLMLFMFSSSFFRKNKNRSCRPEVFCKKDVLRNVGKFTGKHLCQSLFLNKVAGLWKRGSGTGFFLTEHLRWLLL